MKWLALVGALTLAGCGAKTPLTRTVLVKAPEVIRTEKVLVEVPAKIPAEMLKGYPCPYPKGAPLNQFVEVDYKKTQCLETYEAIIRALTTKYGVKP